MTDFDPNLRSKHLRPDHQHTGARVYKSTDFSHTSSGNWVAVTYDTERWDEENYWISTANSRLTVPVPGLYGIVGHAMFASDATGVRGLGIVLNGATFLAIQSEPARAGTLQLGVSTMYKFTFGDYVELHAYQSSGGTLAITAAGNYSPEFAIQRLAPYV